MAQLIKPQIKWTEDKIEKLKKYYPLGKGKELCEELGIKKVALKAAAKRFGVKGDNRRFGLKYFNSEELEVYYWMGFIMADGNINDGGHLRITISNKDKEHLKILSQKIGGKISSETKKTPYGISEVCFLRCSDVVNGIALKKKMNITSNKTYNAPKLNFFKTKEQAVAFFIGFSDGDGMIGWKYDVPYILRINCHYNWLKNFEIFKKYIIKFGIKTSVVRIDKRGNSVFSISTSSDILKIRKWAIDNNIPIMKRKWFTENKPSDYKSKIRNKYSNVFKLIQDGNTYQQLSKTLNIKRKDIYNYVYVHKELYSLYKKVQKIEI